MLVTNGTDHTWQNLYERHTWRVLGKSLKPYLNYSCSTLLPDTRVGQKTSKIEARVQRKTQKNLQTIPKCPTK